ncbi:Multimerin-2 [Bagarius yarrelli]|uniref:Multimerin-2 n=1 Tax=Bagarius yarrelli TaxID=175774 RepID=A0A556TJG3_BAGYA|nr:Multimerin-2 [Bagarius yarrelli]
MDLTVLMLLLAMLSCSSGFSELKARNSDIEEENTGLMSSFSTSHKPNGQEHLSTSGQRDTQMETPQNPHQPARRGNWCAFVHQRLVSVAELSDAEKRIVKSVNPCSNGDPDCRILKYQLSQPTYRQKQKTVTALQWKCCPGHGGKDCQETVSATAESQSPREHSETAPIDVLQADDSGNGGDIPSSTPPPSSAASTLPLMDSSSLLAFHQILSAVMIQLQPMLDGFNHTLEHLSRKVEGLSVDVRNLRHEKESMSKARHANEAKCEKKLEDSFEQMQQIWTDLDAQQKDIEQKIHLQQERLLHNMTSLKDKIDHYIDTSRKEVQVSLQSLNKSMEEIRLDHERIQETTQEGPALPDESESPLETSLWEAISSLDMKVLNNTMELGPLTENSKHLINIVQKLDHGLRNLSERLEHVSHNTEVHLAQISFEVEAARVATQKTVNELASNHSNQERELRETQLDVDNIYQHLQNNEPVTAGEICSCKEMSDLLARLESDVANVTNIAKENRYTLEDVEAKKGLSQWTPEVEDLNQGLWSVRESLAFEQVKRKALHDNLAQLKTSVLDSQKEITGLKDLFIAKEVEIRHLSSSFTSLLKDAIRHSEVLEVLLGDEVMEFSSWSNIQQKQLAIPALLQKMRLMQEKIESHERSLNPLEKSSTEKTRMTNDDPVAFTEWSLTEDQVSDAEDHLDTLADITKKDDDEDYSVSDFWSLGKEVEQLANRISLLELQPCNCTAAPSGPIVKLQADVKTLHQTLKGHLRTFQNLFRFTEELANSSDGVNLDQLHHMTRSKERKRNKGQNTRKKGETSSGTSERDIGKK